MEKPVVILMTCDTKPRLAAYVKSHVERMGARATLVNIALRRKALKVEPDISNVQIAQMGGVDFDSIENAPSRGDAVVAMAQALKPALKKLYDDGDLGGVICLGGAGSFIAAPAMQQLPIGVPKMLVSPLASGNRTFEPFVGTSDMIVMDSVVDIAELNNISRKVFDNAASAIAGMVLAANRFEQVDDNMANIGVSMMGTTTLGATAAMDVLHEAGYNCVVFHATGGGKAMERLIREGAFVGILDYTLAEMVGTHIAGFSKADPWRMGVAGQYGLPQVVVPGCVDFINLFPHEVNLKEYRDRVIYNHSPQYPLARTNKEEMLILAEKIAEQLNKSQAAVEVVLPKKGFSQANYPGGPFWNPGSDDAFRAKLAELLSSKIAVTQVDYHINDEACGKLAGKKLAALIEQNKF